ncbi:uncharacterized protein LOC141909126 [Tubulanus polymorphus]|uniref:uncharacterized protein LOC141909126 n=1 Tax=Tubulanus polymorphus TaxID=672921 RepID=UPI003DA6647C
MTYYRQYMQLLLVIASIILIAAYPAEKRKKECASSNDPEIPDRRANNKAGIGDLFLKHLRFRNVDDEEEKKELAKEMGLLDDKNYRKRAGSLSVSALADMLSNMRQRQQNGGGVRMQTLRFGRK